MSKTVRGIFLLTVAGFIVILAGYLIQTVLGRVLGPANYGLFTAINALISVTSVITTAGVPIAVSKYVSEMEAKEMRHESRTILKKGLLLELLLVLPVFLFYILAAGWLAKGIGDPNAAILIRIAAVGVIFSAMYGVFDNFLNGMKKFGRQTIEIVSINIGKMAAIPFVLLSYGVAGAFVGYVLGGLVGMLVAAVFCILLAREIGKERHTGEKTIGYGRLINFAVPVLVMTLLFNNIYNLDILAVKVLSKSDEITGYYSAAAMIARVPLYLFAGLAAVLLPSLSGTISTGMKEATQKYLRNAIRYVPMILLPMALAVALTSSSLVSLIYTNTYVTAGPTLGVLFFGMILVVFLQLLSTVINAEGKSWEITKIMAVAIAVLISLSILLIPIIGMIGAAIGVTISAAVGILLAGNYVSKRHQVSIDMGSARNTIIGLIVIAVLWFALSLVSQWNGLMLVVEYGILYAGYWIMIVLLGEVKNEDWEMVSKMIPKNVSETIKPFIVRG